MENVKFFVILIGLLFLNTMQSPITVRFEDLRCERGKYRFEKHPLFSGEHVVLNCGPRLTYIPRLPNQNIRAAFFDEVIFFLPEAIRSAKERRSCSLFANALFIKMPLLSHGKGNSPSPLVEEFAVQTEVYRGFPAMKYVLVMH